MSAIAGSIFLNVFLKRIIFIQHGLEQSMTIRLSADTAKASPSQKLFPDSI